LRRSRPVEIFYSASPVKMSFHSHDEYEIYYFHGGKCNYLIGDKIYALAPGDLIIMHGMTLHCPNVEGSDYRRTIIHFDPSFVQPFAHVLSIDLLKPFQELRNYRIRLDGRDKKEIESHLADMLELYESGYSLDAVRFQLRFIELLALIYRHCQTRMQVGQEPASDKERHVQNIISFLELHYGEDLHMEHLESHFHLSKFYLSKIFKEVTGVTVFTYLYHRRINRAKTLLLLDPKRPVTDVCYEVGFKHPSHFCRMFKKVTGMTPEQFRGKHAKRNAGDRQSEHRSAHKKTGDAAPRAD